MDSPEMPFDRRQRDVPVAVERRKRGRPRKERTLVVSVRLPTSVYDRYCIVAQRTRPGPADVRTILRHILTLHAP